MFKDKYDIRKCLHCNGKGYNEESNSTFENKIEYKIITARGRCFKCNGTGKEKYVKKYALIKNIKWDSPIGIQFNFKSKHIRIAPDGWICIGRYIGRMFIWHFDLHKFFKWLKIPYKYYQINDNDGMFEFSFLSFRKYGGDYIMPEHYGGNFQILGLLFSADWTDEGKWIECKQCGNYIPKTKDFKDKLCTDCLYNTNQIVVEKKLEQFN